MRKATPKTLYVITVHAESYRNNLFYDEVRRGINIEANLQGVNVEFLFGFKHPKSIFNNALGIIFAPDGSRECKHFVDSLKKIYQIPIIQIDNQVFDQKKAPAFDAFIGIDNEHGGALTAEYLQSFLPPGSRILVVAGNEMLHYLSYNLRFDGFKKVAGNHFTIIDVLYGEFDHQVVYTKIHDYFFNKPTLPDAIFAFNDDSAIVARKVLDALRIKKTILVTGFDGSVAGRVALSKKDILCSYDQNPENLGRKSFSIFRSLQKGEAVEKITRIRSTLLTQQNIGNTFYAGVTNFLDRTMNPFSFRKRRYEIVDSTVLDNKPLSEFRNELICPIIRGPITMLLTVVKRVDSQHFVMVSDNGPFLQKERGRIARVLKGYGLKVSDVSFPRGEKNKTPENLIALTSHILQKKISKKTCLVLLGGGITGNVGGLAASLLYRGVRFIHIPTTLMHMVDSSTGGKQAVDTVYGKNTLGSFFEPECILIDSTYIRSLPRREVSNGLSECAKHALCQDVDFYRFMYREGPGFLKKYGKQHEELIDRAIRLKQTLLDKDSFELNQGMALVYGHTLGHAIESASGYRLLHGEAVSIGMVAAAHISCALGIAHKDIIQKHTTLLERCGLPVKIPGYISRAAIKRYVVFDKKYVDRPRSFILLSDVGRVYMKNGCVPQEVPTAIIDKALDQLFRE